MEHRQTLRLFFRNGVHHVKGKVKTLRVGKMHMFRRSQLIDHDLNKIFHVIRLAFFIGSRN